MTIMKETDLPGSALASSAANASLEVTKRYVPRGQILAGLEKSISSVGSVKGDAEFP